MDMHACRVIASVFTNAQTARAEEHASKDGISTYPDNITMYRQQMAESNLHTLQIEVVSQRHTRVERRPASFAPR